MASPGPANEGKPAVGFVGVGSMGWPMAAQLVAKGYVVEVADGRREIADNFAQQVGGRGADSLGQLAAASDLVITMLPTSAIVSAVLDEVLPQLRPGTIVVDMSSGEPNVTRALAARVAEAGGHMIDAPVSGGVSRARTGDLAIMVGGDSAAIAQARPVLEAMGSSLTETGAIGSAHAMKALNNLVSAGGFLIAVEALLAGSRFGLDPALMVDVLNASTGMNNSTQKKLKQFVLSRRFDSGFGLDLLVKDLGIALGVARDTATPVPFSSLCRELALAAQAMVGLGRDHTELAIVSERLAGRELPGPTGQ